MRLGDLDALKKDVVRYLPQGADEFGEVSVEVAERSFIDIIDRQPTIEAEPVRHGRWVWDDNAMDWGLGGWICSECQEKNDNIPMRPDIHPSGWVGSHYCPNCGAKMDLEE